MSAAYRNKRDGDNSIAWRSGWKKLARLWRPAAERNVDDELQFHFEQKVADFVAQGMSARDARARAEEEFGDVATVRDSLTEIDHRVASRKKRAEWWESFGQDLRYVLRGLRRSPVFTSTVVITLALGVGANAAIFSLLDRLYLQPTPGVVNAHEVSRVYQRFQNRNEVATRSRFAYPEIRALRESAPEGTTVATYMSGKPRLGRTGDAPEVRVTYVEGDYFRVAGVQPKLGRLFAPDEYRADGMAMVAVLSDALWRSKYGADPAAIGQTIDLGAHRHVIIGVSPPAFRGFELDAADIWVPLNSMGNLQTRKPDWYESKSMIAMGALLRIPRAGDSLAFQSRAARALKSVGIIGDSTSMVFMGSPTATLSSRGQNAELTLSTRLAGVAAVILLIACANVVNLLLSRANQRQRETAVRLALGVSRQRLLRQILTESVVMALLSGMIALYVAHVLGTIMRTLLLPDVAWGTAIVGPRLITVTMLLSVVAGVAVSLISTAQYSRPDLSGALKATSRNGGRRSHWVRSGSLVAQTGLSIVLLAAAGVFVRSLKGVEAIDIGYDINNVAFVWVGNDTEIANHRTDIIERIPALAERISRTPGVQSTALVSIMPMYGFGFESLFLPDRDSLPPSNGAEKSMSIVSPGYFSTVGIKLKKGRDFELTDRKGAEPVIIVSELLASNFWPGQDALTKCVIVGERTDPCRRVVGVVGDTHFSAIVEGDAMQYYVPAEQFPPSGSMRIAVRVADGQLNAIQPYLIRAVRAEYPDWAIPTVKTLASALERELRPWRTGAAIFTGAGLLALLVAAIGVYSSIAYTIEQRTREMGVRIALGARVNDIVRLVVGEGIRVVGAGILLGTLAAIALGSVVKSLLYETSPRDPLVLTASAVVLLAVAVIASGIPAWRASRVDPLAALRSE